MASFVSSAETFLVEELPAYLPSGQGEHTFLWIEKRELTTWDAVNTLARRLGGAPRDIGCAGVKDKHAVTRLWLSIPRVAPDVALQAGDEQLRVLQAVPHGNKLRTGPLRGNRFEVVLTELQPGEALQARTEAQLRRRVLAGDVLQKAASGGVVVTEDPALDQPRLDAGEVVITGPMPGGWAKEPPPATAARALEAGALATDGVTREELAAARELPGTRRPL